MQADLSVGMTLRRFLVELMAWASKADVALVRAFLARPEWQGFHVDSDDKATHHDSALHECTFRGLLESVATLLEAGADPNRYDREGRTVLHMACESWAKAAHVMLDRATGTGGTPCAPGELAADPRLPTRHPHGRVQDVAPGQGTLRCAAKGGDEALARRVVTEFGIEVHPSLFTTIFCGKYEEPLNGATSYLLHEAPWTFDDAEIVRAVTWAVTAGGHTGGGNPMVFEEMWCRSEGRQIRWPTELLELALCHVDCIQHEHVLSRKREMAMCKRRVEVLTAILERVPLGREEAARLRLLDKAYDVAMGPAQRKLLLRALFARGAAVNKGGTHDAADWPESARSIRSAADARSLLSSTTDGQLGLEDVTSWTEWNQAVNRRVRATALSLVPLSTEDVERDVSAEWDEWAVGVERRVRERAELLGEQLVELVLPYDLCETIARESMRDEGACFSL